MNHNVNVFREKSSIFFFSLRLGLGQISIWLLLKKNKSKKNIPSVYWVTKQGKAKIEETKTNSIWRNENWFNENAKFKTIGIKKIVSVIRECVSVFIFYCYRCECAEKSERIVKNAKKSNKIFQHMRACGEKEKKPFVFVMSIVKIQQPKRKNMRLYKRGQTKLISMNFFSSFSLLA